MSGHSKWANIRRKKEKTDSWKGKVYTKLGREIAVAVRQGGADPEANTRLKDVIVKAKLNNMPGENIARCVKKAAGDMDNESYEQIRYEGYGPGGIAMLVDAMTDNRNRTAGDVRHLFDKFGGNLGQSGCVSFMFNEKGVIVIDKENGSDDDMMLMEALEAGAEDFSVQEEAYEIITAPQDFSRVRGVLESKGYVFLEAEVTMLPITMTKLPDPRYVDNMEKLVEHLEDLDDVQKVCHNMEENDDV